VTIVDCAEGQSYGRLSGPTPPLENRASVGALSGRPTPGTLCIRRDARTPLVVTPMQAVSAGPATCPEVGSCRSPRRRASDVPHAQANNDVGGDEGVRGRSEPAIRSVWQYIPFSTVTDEQPVARQLDHLFTWSPVLRSTLTRTAARREGRLLLCAPPTGSAGRFAIRGGLPNGSDVVVIRILARPALALGVD
jgi:hypothetical protein